MSTTTEQIITEADRMRLLASQYKQLGFVMLARFLRKNADKAMKWACKEGGCSMDAGGCGMDGAGGG